MEEAHPLLQEKHEEWKEQRDDHPVRVWFPTPQSHSVFVVSVIVSIILSVTGILLIWGPTVALATFILLMILTVWIHFLRQKWLRLDQGILYFDRGEFFIIFLNKKDTELGKYLHGRLQKDSADKSPEELLLDLARLSVISHIPKVLVIREVNDTTILFVSHRVIPYPQTSLMEIPVNAQKYEHFDELMQIALSLMDDGIKKAGKRTQ